MKNIFSVLCVCVVAALVLVSCLEGVGNKSESTFAVIVSENSKMGGKTLLTAHELGELAVSASDASKLSEYKPGDCLLVYLTLDWDNQPARDYVTASDLRNLTPIDQSPVQIKDEVTLDFPVDSILPIKGISLYANYATLRGKFFMQIRHETPAKQLLDYVMIVPSNSEKEEKDIYLISKKINQLEESGKIWDNIHAFDILNAIQTLGKDTTINTIPYRVLAANIKYCTGVNNGEPVYSTYPMSPTQPLVFAVYK